MNKFVKMIFEGDGEVAPPQLVFLSVTIVALLQFPAYFMMRSGWMMSGILSNQLIAILGVPLLLIWLLKLKKKRLIAIAWPGLLSMLLFVFITLSADILMEYLTSFSESFIPLPDNVRRAIQDLIAIDSADSLVVKISLLCVLPAICEEIFFRGYCQTSLAARWGNIPAIMASALIFAMLHGNPWYIHLYFILGVFLGWTYAVTGTLAVPIACHMINNIWTIAINHYKIEFPIHQGSGVTNYVIIAGCILSVLALFRIYKIYNNNRVLDLP
ncbi:MAG: CPBP family intramembrane metalloprotease [Deltaproteobacteria bacterium]|jgi:sodium transport system permease protein|nr:CPBP family intramembrane metalloprotease [Deltaproteobacteria bacterium]